MINFFIIDDRILIYFYPKEWLPPELFEIDNQIFDRLKVIRCVDKIFACVYNIPFKMQLRKDYLLACLHDRLNEKNKKN